MATEQKRLEEFDKKTTFDNGDAIVITNKDANLVNNMDKENFATAIKDEMSLGTAADANIGDTEDDVVVWDDAPQTGACEYAGSGKIRTIPIGTAYNKNYGGSGGNFGVAGNTARTDHSHAQFDNMVYSYNRIITDTTSIIIDEATLISSLPFTISEVDPAVTIVLYEKSGGFFLPVASPNITVTYNTETVSGGTNYTLNQISISTLTTTKEYMFSIKFSQGHIFVVDGGSPT
jgi:hypothetical protein